MRLICPNCDAEYEVDDGAIPLTGRDVQCSNCGHAWFQRHPDAPVSPTPVPPAAGTPEPALPGDDAAPAAPAEPAAALPDDLPPPSSRLDAAALAMLKEEAARELAARRAPAPIEVQGDLGLPPPAPAQAPAASPAPAPLLAAPPAEPVLPAGVAAWAGAGAAEAAQAPSRRSRLPDIEEINSTLRPRDHPPGHQSAMPAEDSEADAPAAGSFRAGFLLVIALATVLTLLYALAPQLAAAVPALEAPLAGYVQTVDALRLWLDGALRGLIDSLRGLAAPAT